MKKLLFTLVVVLMQLNCAARPIGDYYADETVFSPPTITTQPIDQLDCEGASVSFKVIASGTGLTYTWQRKKPTDSGFITIPSETNVSYPSTGKITITNVGSSQSPNGTQYQVIISDGTNTVVSNAVTLTINEILGISPSSTNVTQCFGANYSYTVSTSYPANVVSYQWKSSVTSGVWNNVIDGAHFSGANTASLNIINGSPNESAQYRVYITFHSSGADCDVDSSSRIRKITFLPLLTIPIATITQPNCITNTGTITITVQSAGDTYSFDNGVNFQVSNSKSGLVAGSYNAIIKNIGACVSVTTTCVISPAVTSVWNGSLWSPSPPTSTDAIVFAADFTSSGDITGCSCIVTSGTVLFKSGHTLTITNNLNVSGGTLTFENNASLVQINDASTNTGSITYERDVNIRKYDYVYWSSPVVGFTTNAISSGTSSGYIFKWNPIISNGNGGQGNWVGASGDLMTGGIGYIIRGPSSFSNASASLLKAFFSGKPNNGIITSSISRGTYIGGGYNGTNGIPITKFDDNYNLLGNPYPSSIKALDFLTLNTNIEGAVHLWAHGNLPSGLASSPFYGSYTYNYSTTDYIVYNGTGTISGPAGFDGYIAAGQGFFVSMNDGPAATETVTFNNSMRSKSYDNSQFYKNTAVTKALINQEKHRIWLDLLDSDKKAVRTLVGYVENATMDKDRLFDANASVGSSLNIFSIVEGESLSIQGRPVPFDKNDQVSIGVKIPVEGSYTIAIAALDGLFEQHQEVYLEDKLQNVIHDLRKEPYVFTSLSGVFNGRFVLRYDSAALSIQKADLLNNKVSVVANQDKLTVKSSIEVIQDIVVYDLLGRQLFEVRAVRNNEYISSPVYISQQTLIVKVKLVNGLTVTRKVIF